MAAKVRSLYAFNVSDSPIISLIADVVQASAPATDGTSQRRIPTLLYQQGSCEMCVNFRGVSAIAAVIVSSVSWPAMAKQISLDPEAWDIRFSYDMPEHPAADGAVGRLTSPRVPTA